MQHHKSLIIIIYHYIYPSLHRFHNYIINYNTHSQKQVQQSSIFIFHSFHIHITHIIQSSITPLTHPLPITSITQYINTIILISTYIYHITQYSSSISLSYSIILLSQITTYSSLLPLIIPDYIQYIAPFYSILFSNFHFLHNQSILLFILISSNLILFTSISILYYSIDCLLLLCYLIFSLSLFLFLSLFYPSYSILFYHMMLFYVILYPLILFSLSS